MNEEALKILKYKAKVDKPIPVPDFQIASLRLFIKYCKFRARANTHVHGYTNLTQDDLNQFNLLVPVTVTSPVPGSNTYLPTDSTPAMKGFNRGIKRDLNNFLKFSNEQNWSDYQDHTIATANSQHVESILNTTYVPINGDARK